MKKILIIDDNALIINEVKDILIMEGYQVLTAPNALEGIELAIQFKPHLIITDINMPKMDGYGLISILKTHAESRNIPIIVMSSYYSNEHVRKALLLEADLYLKKPCGVDELIISADLLLRAA